MPTDDGDFVLDTDASYFATGAVLSQRQNGVERIIAYARRAVDRRKQNYCVTRKELLAVVHFLAFFKQYLLGRYFTVRTDHAALTWLRHTPASFGQQARWLERLEEFQFLIEHRPGTRHGNADAISRRPCPKKNCACAEGATSIDTTLIFFGGPTDWSSIVTRNGDLIPEDDDLIASSVLTIRVTTGNPTSRSTVISRGDTSIVMNYCNVEKNVII